MFKTFTWKYQDQQSYHHPLSALKLSNALENPMKVLLKGMIPLNIEFQMHKNS